MAATPWYYRVFPRSLWLQTVLLLLLALALTSAVAVKPLLQRFRRQFASELQKRGRTTVQTLARDYELRPAIMLKDPVPAEPILNKIAAEDEEVLYIAILKGRELVAVAPAWVNTAALRAAIKLHFEPGTNHNADILRFTETVRAEKALDFMADATGEQDGAVAGLGYVVLALSGQKIERRAIEQTIYSIGASSLGVFTLLILFYFRWVARRMSRMVNFAQAAASGDSEQKLEDPIVDDVGRLAGALQDSYHDLHRVNAGLEAEVEARTGQLQLTLSELWSEIDLARKIQSVLLPPPQTFLSRFEFAGVMRPADEVGGDYYDAFESDGRLWVLIGDVSGHGVSAGLIMMMVQTTVRALVSSFAAMKLPLLPSQLLTLVNRAVWSNLQLIGKGQYMTMTAVLLDGPPNDQANKEANEQDLPPADKPRSTKAIYAGLHQSLLVYRSAEHTVTELESRGSWLGLIDEIEGLNEDSVVELAAGDALLLFTDGLIESRRKDDETKLVEIEAVKERFLEVCRKKQSCEEMTKNILSVSTDGIVKDDISAVALRRLV